MSSLINSEAGDLAPTDTVRKILVQTDEVELTAEELGMGAGRIMGEPKNDECEFVPAPSFYSLHAPPKPTARRPGGRRRRAPESFRTTLFEELQPLSECINELGGSRSRMLWTETRPSARRPFPPRAMVSIGECAVVFDLHLWEQPVGFRNQLLWTLLRVARYGATYYRNGRTAGQVEIRRGSLRVPLRFELERRTDGSGAIDTVGWSQRLHVTCAETDSVQAIRRQVDLLCEHLANRNNWMPVNTASMLV